MTAISSTDAQLRLSKLRVLIKEAGFDVAALIPGATLYYLTGIHFHLSERPIILFVPADGEVGMILPALEEQHVIEKQPFPIQPFVYSDRQGYGVAFDAASKTLSLAGKRVAVEGLQMRVLEGQTIQQYAPNSQIISADKVISRIRLHKQASEIALMRNAIAISEAALEATIGQIEVGMTEQRVAHILHSEMTQRGGQGLAFESAILTGANSALPHGGPGDSVIREGDLLLFDYGAKVSAYPADITRVFAVGKLDPELEKIYRLVKAANEAGIAAAKPGVTAQDVDRATRKVIADAGYGDYFVHRTGHGLGLDVHEAPDILEGNTQVLEPGMIFTIEPGIYLPGKGGVRIEDNILITETGCEVLTSFPKTLRTIGV
ncbi:MAG: aminopeptidase P family protein [Anaerolineae bacterium]|nr:aminopeptidase P family protein [Anaerolineae bacterium]